MMETHVGHAGKDLGCYDNDVHASRQWRLLVAFSVAQEHVGFANKTHCQYILGSQWDNAPGNMAYNTGLTRENCVELLG